jgi:hypothetical protein
MLAAKSRGSPRRSPSSPSSLASKLASELASVRSDDPTARHTRQTARHPPGFFVACHIHASSHAATDPRLEDCGVRTTMRSVVLPAGEFATPETFSAVQKTPARRAQIEFACLRVLHTVVSPERHTRWSYPVKRDSKNGVSLITYRHSEAKHLENSPARRARDAFVKNFWQWLKIVT